MPPEAPLDPRQLTGAELHALFAARTKAGQVRAGIDDFERICRANPRWGLAYDLLGRLYESDGQDDRAYEAYRTGMEIGLRSRRMSRELKTDLVVKVVEFCTIEVPGPAKLDMLLSCGERASMALLVMALHELGEQAVSLTGSQSGIITNARHSGARIVEVRPFRVEDEIADGKIRSTEIFEYGDEAAARQRFDELTQTEGAP